MLLFRFWSSLVLGSIVFAASVCEASSLSFACSAWMEELSHEQRSVLLRPPSEANAWHFLPLNDPRHPNLISAGNYRGLHFSQMSERQRLDLEILIEEVFGGSLLRELQIVRSLDQYLKDQNLPGRMDPRFKNENYGEHSYLVSMIGYPDSRSPFQLRVQGHHFSASVEIVDNQIVSSGPLFLGAWPRASLVAPRDRTVIDQFDEEHRLLTDELEPWLIRRMVPPMDRPLRNQLGPDVSNLTWISPSGIDVGRLNDSSRARVFRMIQIYIEALPESLRSRYYAQLERSMRQNEVHLRAGGNLSDYHGGKSILIQVGHGDENGFSIEYIAVDHSGDHIHSLWRPN